MGSHNEQNQTSITLNLESKFDHGLCKTLLASRDIQEKYASLIMYNLRQDGIALICRDLVKALNEKTGNRKKIIKDTCVNLGLKENYDILSGFLSKSFKACEKHCYCFIYTEHDSQESQSFYRCIYCGQEGERSKWSSLDGDVLASPLWKPWDTLEKGKGLLHNIEISNPNVDEVTKFATILLQITFGD